MSEGSGTNEYLITRHSQFRIPINVINVYGEQENRTSAESVVDHWNEILEEVVKIEAKAEHLIVIGDLNRHLPCHKEYNNNKVSAGGKLVQEFIDNNNYVLVNETSIMQNGPYTRVDPADPENDSKKSVLDLIIMSKDLFKYVESVIVDKERKFTPSHTQKKNKVTYPDHYALMMTMKNIPRVKTSQKKPPKVIMWNTNKKDGWEKYKHATENNKVFNNIANGDVTTSEPNSVAKRIEKEITKVKFRSFGKIKYSNETKENKVLDELYSKKRNCKDEKEIEVIDNAIRDELENARKQDLDSEIEKFRKIRYKRGNVAAVFKLKETIAGSKKVNQEPTTLIDPVTKLEVDSVKEIKRISIEYCKNLLTNREPRKGFEDIVRNKIKIHDERMAEEVPENEANLTKEMFNNALERIQRKNPKKYSFILKAGQSYIDSLFFLFQAVWKHEVIPDDWKKTDIVQIFKGKGPQSDISGYRCIHTKIITRKVFGEIVTHEIKAKICENISKFQIGAIPGHRPQEHLYTIKNTIAHYNKMGKGILLCLYDVSKFFDRENLRDCCGELYRLNIKGKIYRLVYKLNKDTDIRVRTAVGYTEYDDVGETLGQGTNESGVISSASLSGGVTDFFHDSNCEVNFAGMVLAPCLFQDDIARMAENLEAVAEGNRRLEAMAESKLLDYNEGKSGMIVFGGRKFQKKIKDELSRNPVMFCGKPMKVFECERYLGDFLGSSLAQSVFLTIQKRKGLVQRLISEIRVTLKDIRSDTIGGLIVGLEIWRKAVIPFLWNNSECWFEMPKKALDLINSLTNSFFRTLFCSAKGNPIIMYYWDTKSLLNENFLLLRKLLFVHHLLSLPDDSLAKNIFNLKEEHEQESEYKRLLEAAEIDEDPTHFSKIHWKKHVSRKVHLKNEREVRSQIESSNKLDKEKLSAEEYEVKSYLSSMKISEGRTFFSSRSMMMSTVQFNFKNKPEYKANNYKCKCGDHLDTQNNLLACRLYEHLREGLDLANSDTDLVKYFQLVIKERLQEQDNNK